MKEVMQRIYLSVFKGSRYPGKAAKLHETNLYEILERQKNEIAADTQKASDWKIYPYLSEDGCYHGKDATHYVGTGILLMDIDSKVVYSYLREHTSELFEQMSNIIAIWPSYSRKVHLCIFAQSLFNLKGEVFTEEYARLYSMYMSRFVEVYEQMTGTCAYEMKEEGAPFCDTHNANLNQAICLNHIDEYYINEQSDNDETLAKRTNEYIAKYPRLWGIKNTQKKDKQVDPDCDLTKIDIVSATISNDGKYLIDRNFCIKGYCGNALRFRLARAILSICNNNVAKATQVIREKFSNADEIISNLSSVADYKVNKDIETWVRQHIITSYEADNDKIITLNEGQYVSDYADDIMSHVSAGGNVYLKAGCGVGKSSFYRKVVREYERVIIIVHMNSIKEGVYCIDGELKQYVISTKEMKRIVRRGDKLPSKMIIVWNTYEAILNNPRTSSETDNYIKLFDESHNLVTSLDYRRNEIYSITSRPFSRTIFCTATPAGEHALLGNNCAKYEFVKGNTRTTTYTMLQMCDARGNEVQRENIRLYDYVTTIRDYIVTNYNEYDAFIAFDNRNHERLSEMLPTIGINFCRPEKEAGNEQVTAVLDDNSVKCKVFISTSFGCEGIEIKGREDVVGYDKETWDAIVEIGKIKRICAIYPVWNLTKTTVEQSINRFREVEHVDVIFVRSDDPREWLSWGVAQGDTLDYVTDKLCDEEGRDEISNADLYYLDSSLYYPQERLMSNVDEVATLSRLQYLHKRHDTLTSSNLQIMYSDLCVFKHVYAVADNEKNISVGETYSRFRAEHYKIFFCERITEQAIRQATENYNAYCVNGWEQNAIVRKAIRNDVKNIEDILLYACELRQREDNIVMFYRGLTRFAGLFVYGGKLHLNPLKQLLRWRFLFRGGDDYLYPVNNNKEQEKNTADKRAWFYNKVYELNLDPSLEVDNYEWICAMCEREIADIKKDSRGRTKKKKKYKFALVDNKDVKFYTKEEAFNYLKTEGVQLSTFIRRGWKKYLVSL